MEKIDLDKILLNLGGWGKFQKLNYLYLCSVIIFSVFPMSYIFVARDIKYRCVIDNCVSDNADEYNPKWLKNAVPFKNDVPNRCLRYTAKSNITCIDFDKNSIEVCDEFVYERKEITIVHDFNITCDQNLWKLTIVGTINVMGELICLPFTGIISDKFGRKSMMIISSLLSTMCGLLRSFAPTYSTYLALEILDTALGSGMYGAAFIIAMELVNTKHRNKGNTILCCTFAFGQVLLGAVAYISPSWRIMLRILYGPGVLFVALFWLIPESVRWLLSKGKNERAETILKSMAITNNKEMMEEEVKMFLTNQNSEEYLETNKNSVSLLEIFKSKTLLLRIIICSFTWICCNFPYYGLTIHSVSLSKNIYTNFIFTALIEIPAYLITYCVLDRLGRRITLCASLLLSGVACILVGYTESIHIALGMTSFLAGKFFMTIAYTTLYIYTTEMFPTKSRHLTFSICSMFGRVGSMLAPQVPLLARISRTLPLIIFAIMAISSGILALYFPETLNMKLPETIRAAKDIRKNAQQLKNSCDDVEN